MAEKEESKKTFATCLEGIPLAEMMQKMTGQQGIGSLCAKMMKRFGEKKGKEFDFSCSEMMKGCCGFTEEIKDVKKEEDHA